jgi:predicted nucleic acid-binding protein
MIVLDASTAILLAKVDLLDQFVETVKQPVVMPKEVERECHGQPDALDARRIAKAVAESRIKVQALRGRRQNEKLRRDFTLGSGEAAAIVLALDSRDAVVATDDRQAINACKLLRLPFTTAVAVLVRMRENGLLSAEEAIIKLEALARYGRYKERTIQAARCELEAK